MKSIAPSVDLRAAALVALLAGLASCSPRHPVSSTERPPGPGLSVDLLEADWIEDSDHSRLELTGSAPVTFHEEPPARGQHVLVLDGLRVPERLRRTLGTDAFTTAVSRIQIQQAEGAARIVMDVDDGGFSVESRERVLSIGFAHDGPRHAVVHSSGAAFTGRKLSLAADGATSDQVFQLLARTANFSVVGRDEDGIRIHLRRTNYPWDLTLTQFVGFARVSPVRVGEVLCFGCIGGAVADLSSGPEVNLDRQGAELEDVLQGFADTLHRPIVVDERARGRLSVRFSHVRWDHALECVADLLRLSVREDEDRIRLERLDADTASSAVRIISPHASPTLDATSVPETPGLDEFRVIGMVFGISHPRALIVGGDGRASVVQDHDRLGAHTVVTKISATSVAVEDDRHPGEARELRFSLPITGQ